MCIKMGPVPISYPATTPLFPGATLPHRFLEVVLGQLDVLRVMVEDRAELEVRPGLDPLRRFKLEHGLKAVNT